MDWCSKHSDIQIVKLNQCEITIKCKTFKVKLVIKYDPQEKAFHRL